MLPGEGGTKRAEEDAYAKFKYDATATQDNVIISRVAKLAEKHGVTMTEVSLALFTAEGFGTLWNLSQNTNLDIPSMTDILNPVSFCSS